MSNQQNANEEIDSKIEAIFDKADDLMINQKKFKEAVRCLIENRILIIFIVKTI